MDNINKKFPKISSAMLVLTHQCPMACRYCFVEQEPTEMSFEIAKKAADFLIKNAEEENAIPHINFFGGEPLLKYETIIKPLTLWIRKEYKKPFNLSITTNGILLDEEKINFLRDNNFGILLSIDGDKETQNYNRPLHNGQGTFEILKPLLPKILEKWPHTTFRMTIIPETCQNIFRNIIFAKETGFDNFFMVPNIFQEWPNEKREILEKEIRKYSNYYIKSFEKEELPIQFSSLRDAFLAIKKINEAINNNNFRTLPRCQGCNKCGLGGTSFSSIHPNGNIYACQELTSNEGENSIFCIGDIFSGVNDQKRQFLIGLYDSKTVVGENCNQCKYNRICDGGCVANNYLKTGNVNCMPEVYCWWRRILLEEAIYIMQELGNKKNVFFKRFWESVNG